MTEIFPFQSLADGRDLAQLLTPLGLNLLFAGLIIRGLYYRLYRNREFVFTYFLFNLITFFLAQLLRQIPGELGFALAIFGIFGILRYRTEQIRNRDLTYLFTVIGIALLNSVAGRETSLAELILINATVVGAAAWLELKPAGDGDTATPMLYDRLDLLKPGNEDKLAADILARTGHILVKLQIHRIDMLRDSAEITLHHRAPDGTAMR